jgi:hypothetical protein
VVQEDEWKYSHFLFHVDSRRERGEDCYIYIIYMYRPRVGNLTRDLEAGNNQMGRAE